MARGESCTRYSEKLFLFRIKWSRMKLASVLVFSLLSCTSCAWMFRFANPDRELHAIFFTDGSCLYSFEGLDYGKREDQRWSDSTDLFQKYYRVFEIEKGKAFQRWYSCRNEASKSDNVAFEENWPRVHVIIEQLRPNGILKKNEEGNFPFGVESYRDIYRNRNSSIAEKKGDNFFVSVLLPSNSELNNRKLRLKYGERFSFGTEFKSIDSPKSAGVIYSPRAQYDTGKFMELRVILQAASAL